jgi:hypothetical protein
MLIRAHKSRQKGPQLKADVATKSDGKQKTSLSTSKNQLLYEIRFKTVSDLQIWETFIFFESAQ